MEVSKRYRPKGIHIVILFLAAAVLFVANELRHPIVPPVQTSGQPQVKQPEGAFDLGRIPVPADDPRAIGSPDAPVTIVEFADYECPYCLTAQATLERIVKEYEGKVRLVYRDFPLGSHPRAVPSAIASRCAVDQEAFWDYHKRLWKGVGEDRQQGLSDERLLQYAAELKLDRNSFRECFESKHYAKAVDDDFMLGKSLAIRGTPTFFINGRPLVGVVPYTQFAAAVNEALAQQGVQK